MKDGRKVALVTGAGSGLGRQLCLDLTKNNWFVVASDCNESTNLKQSS